MASETSRVIIREALVSDVPSLTTMVPRAFFPVNSFIKECFPDTLRMRDWWAQIFADEIQSETCHVLSAFDSRTQAVVGVLNLRLMQSDDRGAGFWTKFPLCDDTPKSKYQSALDSMVEYREHIFLGKGQPHFLIELFGVDHQYKGSGLGKLLLQRAGEIADSHGIATFVEANGAASSFYIKSGFRSHGMVVMPGPEKYEEHLLVRPRTEDSS